MGDSERETGEVFIPDLNEEKGFKITGQAASSIPRAAYRSCRGRMEGISHFDTARYIQVEIKTVRKAIAACEMLGWESGIFEERLRVLEEIDPKELHDKVRAQYLDTYSNRNNQASAQKDVSRYGMDTHKCPLEETGNKRACYTQCKIPGRIQKELVGEHSE